MTDEKPEVRRCSNCGNLMEFETDMAHEVEKGPRKLVLLHLSGHKCPSCENTDYDERSEEIINRAKRTKW